MPGVFLIATAIISCNLYDICVTFLYCCNHYFHKQLSQSYLYSYFLFLHILYFLYSTVIVSYVIKPRIAATIIVELRLMREETRGRAARYIDIAIYLLAMELLTSPLSAASAGPGRYLSVGFLRGYGNVSVRRENAPRSRSRPLSRFRIFTASCQ